jgi:hypothetical protein
VRRARRSIGLEPLGDLLLRDSNLRGASSSEAGAVSPRDWEAAVGSRIAARARPVELDRGTLLVLAGSSTWAQELSLLSDEILRQLRGRGLPVERLRFRVGRVAPPDRPPGRYDVRHAPPPAPLPAEVESILGKVEDADLRTAIANAAAVSLGFRAMHEAAEAKAAKETRRRSGRAAPPATSESRAAPDPRSAAPGTDRSDRSSPTSRAARPRKP